MEFDKVSFAYNKEDKDVLHDISFKLNTGEHLALVGNSGSGKTTIARLCARFWDAGSGSVKVGGMILFFYKIFCCCRIILFHKVILQ